MYLCTISKPCIEEEQPQKITPVVCCTQHTPNHSLLNFLKPKQIQKKKNNYITIFNNSNNSNNGRSSSNRVGIVQSYGTLCKTLDTGAKA